MQLDTSSASKKGGHDENCDCFTDFFDFFPFRRFSLKKTWNEEKKKYSIQWFHTEVHQRYNVLTLCTLLRHGDRKMAYLNEMQPVQDHCILPSH